MDFQIVIKSKAHVIEAFPSLFLTTILLCLLVISLPAASYANNMQITASDADDGLVEQDTDAKTIKVQFDITWDNAWNDSINHDAVWVFVKYSTSGSAPYSHATLKTAGTNPSGFSGGSKNSMVFDSLDIVVPPDKMGAFLIPGHAGSGELDIEDVQLVWHYGADGVSDSAASDGTIDVKIFGVEMVYIPESGFIAGGQTGASFGGEGEFEYGDGTDDIAPSVNSEEGIRFRNNTKDAWYYNTDNNGNDAASGAEFDVSEAFPKGYQAFYLMKYEVTQGQYADFLNTLTSTQDSNRFPNQNGSNRHTVSGASGSRSASRPDRAMNYMDWVDLCAFADWAALRPATELEFEKAARGPLSPVQNEFPWGTTSRTDCSSLSGTENGTETCSTGGANYRQSDVSISGGDTGTGPVRAGIFAKNTNTREATGAGYYGNMNLGGNVSEQLVTLGTPEGRGFAGTHGDGNLTSSGTATNDDWPGFTSGSGVNSFAGHGIRGDATDPTYAELTSRYNAADESSTPSGYRGGRGARTAP